MRAREERTVQVLVRLTPREKKILDRRAEADDISGPDHLRVCMIADAVMSGDLEAARILGETLRRKLVERLEAVMRSEAAA